MAQRRIYMDHAATTPMRPEVVQAMLPFASEVFGNASSLHAFGREARAALEGARERVAGFLGARPEEIVFTSGGTESDNAALWGVAMARRDTHRHVVTSRIEHHAVLNACQFMEKLGFRVTYLPVDSGGMVDPEEVGRAIGPDTTLVSIMMANNEIGTLEPIETISRITRERGVPLHTDAVQACGSLPVDVVALGVDLLSLSGHKLYGPKGIGVLYVRRGTPLVPFLHGGEQETRRRGGTENVAAAVGLAMACELAAQDRTEESDRLKGLRDRLIRGVLAVIPDARLNGHEMLRLPGNASFSFEGADSQALLIRLDLAGIAASNGSACASGSPQPSHVLPAIGLPAGLTRSALRLSLGRSNDEAEVDFVIEELARAVEQSRRAGGVEGNVR
ncbi:MAG: aminotransferase class V-fold PLP-dependent enzyme [Planctomycetes bacterium]|nr:aminotransferase class V-fold PLP-dependent enzyme [Planctomycetota bacterium]